ncbi:unnamed protein product [Lactuca virosa]|uniref:Uncharacterized protein n=1 Tax=Lactuca virosa TaxID=75947 RepID=A0AAU9LMC1_9ASTR|nr:unnamed protein product [Lactuca virosa]
MTDRYFENFMRDFEEETSTVDGDSERSEVIAKESQDFILNLLKFRASPLRSKFRQSALYQKESVVRGTWRTRERRIFVNSTLYDGTPGTAFLLLKNFLVNRNRDDLNTSADIIKACDSASGIYRSITFLRGTAGVCALGAVVSKYQGNTQMIERYLARFKKIEVKDYRRDGMLHGRAGHLWACLFLNKHLGDGVIPSSYTNRLVNKMIENGRRLGAGTRCPLMYTYFGTKHLGAADGLAGILHVLMHSLVQNVFNSAMAFSFLVRSVLLPSFPFLLHVRSVVSSCLRRNKGGGSEICRRWWCLDGSRQRQGLWSVFSVVSGGDGGIMVVNWKYVGDDDAWMVLGKSSDFDLTPDVQEDVKKSLKYLINTRFPSGNYPSKEDNREDIFVQWCQGASGMALTLVKAAEVFGDKEFVDAAIEAVETLTKNEEMLNRAKLLACFLLGRGVKLMRKKKMHKGDHPFSLFEGVGGMAYLFLDMMNPDEARFPGYEL